MELKKQIRLIDLSLAAARRRQSLRTGFVHDEEVIPLYENFCFAFALFRHKTTESVTEAKQILEKLLAFEVEGNFPVFLHDYPRCFDFQMPLKVAPLFIYLLRLFSSVLGDLKPKIEKTLARCLARPSEKPNWENRYRACLGQELLPVDTTDFSAAEWTEWLITAQLANMTHFVIPYDKNLQLFKGPSRFDVQEKSEPRPNPVEWLLAEGNFSPRLLQDHAAQILCAPLFPITFDPIEIEDSSLRLFWQGSTLHSLVAKSSLFTLAENIEMGRGDLFEAVVFCDLSPETQILVEGRKATAFQLGDLLTIQTPTLSIDLRFELVSGSGDFRGSILRANRGSQIAKGYEAYDWQIGLRTLRREGPAQIKLHVVATPPATCAATHG
jgi:hypothetical protein